MTRGVAGPDVPLCGRPRRQDDDGERVPAGEGEPCRKVAGTGTPNEGVPGVPCHLHGGRAPNVVAAAARRRAALEVSALLAEEDVTPVDNPIEQLELLAGEVLAWRDLLRRRIGALDHLDHTDKVGREQTRATVELYERSLDRAERILSNMARLNLGERRIQLEERQHAFMAAVVEEVLRRRGLDVASTEVRADLFEVAQALEAGQS